MQGSSWLVCFYLLDRYSSLHLPMRRLLPGMIAVVLLKIVIVKNSVSVTDLVAMVAALLGETPSTLLDVPHISDVEVVQGLLRLHGVIITHDDKTGDMVQTWIIPEFI